MDEIGKLDPRVQECIRKRGFEELSEIQNLALPLAGKGKNLLLIAPTGTGKTEGAMIPVFDGMLKETGGGFTALYITPLRSLNRDMLQRLSWWCAELGLTIGVRHGDTTASERRRQALSPPDLLITTPETLQALFMGKVLRKHLRNVRYVIVDEIHELAGSKRGAQLLRGPREAGPVRRVSSRGSASRRLSETPVRLGGFSAGTGISRRLWSMSPRTWTSLSSLQEISSRSRRSGYRRPSTGTGPPSSLSIPG